MLEYKLCQYNQIKRLRVVGISEVLWSWENVMKKIYTEDKGEKFFHMINLNFHLFQVLIYKFLWQPYFIHIFFKKKYLK